METRIGEAAGKVWTVLSMSRVASTNQVAKAAGLPADLTNQAIGWLARESKVAEEVRAGKVMLKLRS